MAELLKTPEIINLFQQYQMHYDDIVRRMEIASEGARKYYEQREDSEIPAVFRNLNDVMDKLGRFENRQNLSSEGGLVDVKAFSAMEQSQYELQKKWTDIQDIDFASRVIFSAIIYWKDSAIGKYVYFAAKDYLYKLKKSDEKIAEARDLVNQVESLRDKITPTSDFWPKYNELESKLKEMESIRGLIPLRPDELSFAYKEFGLGVVWGPIIKTAIIVVAISGTITVLFFMAMSASFAALVYLVRTAISTILSIWEKVGAKNEKIDKKADESIRKKESVATEQIKTVLADTSLSSEQKTDIIKDINQGTADAIKSINENRNQTKKENTEQAKSLTDKILEMIKGWGDTALIGAGIFAGIIGLIVIVPRIWPKKKGTV